MGGQVPTKNSVYTSLLKEASEPTMSLMPDQAITARGEGGRRKGMGQQGKDTISKCVAHGAIHRRPRRGEGGGGRGEDVVSD